MNKKILNILLAAVLSISFLACSDDDSFTTSRSNGLTFAVDTFSLDTVFTNVMSPGGSFMVYNRSGNGVKISSAKLQNGNQTGFRVNVDGSYLSPTQGYRVNDLELRDGDSLRVYVEMTAVTNHDTSGKPVKVTDDVVFTLESGRVDKVALKAYSWDAIMFKNSHVTEDMTLSNVDNKPIVIYDSLTVDENVTLTIAAGTKLYLHNNSWINVKGRLNVAGEKDKEVVFRCDRLDRMVNNMMYNNAPGMWGGIRFKGKSYDNKISYADIRGAVTAIMLDSAYDASKNRLLLENSTINHVSGDGINTTASKITVNNTQISNANGNCVSIYGGTVNMNYCTIPQYYPFSLNHGHAFYASDINGEKAMYMRLNIVNCLITGSSKDELYLSRKDEKNTDVATFDHCVIRTPEVTGADAVMMKDVIYENPDDSSTNPENKFVLYDLQNFFYDFTPKNGALSVEAATPLSDITIDRKGNSRDTTTPDIGCFETTKTETKE